MTNSECIKIQMYLLHNYVSTSILLTYEMWQIIGPISNTGEHTHTDYVTRCLNRFVSNIHKYLVWFVVAISVSLSAKNMGDTLLELTKTQWQYIFHRIILVSLQFIKLMNILSLTANLTNVKTLYIQYCCSYNHFNWKTIQKMFFKHF